MNKKWLHISCIAFGAVVCTIILLLQVFLTAAAIRAANRKSPPITDRYQNYIPVAGLSVKKKGDQIGKSFRDWRGHQASCYYYSLSGFSEDQLIIGQSVLSLGFSVSSDSCILQNPESPVDVWRDWTVKSILCTYYQNSNENLPRWLNDLFHKKTFRYDPTQERIDVLASMDRNPPEDVPQITVKSYKTVSLEVQYKETSDTVWHAEVSACTAEDGTGIFLLRPDSADWLGVVSPGNPLYNDLEEAFAPLLDAENG